MPHRRQDGGAVQHEKTENSSAVTHNAPKTPVEIDKSSAMWLCLRRKDLFFEFRQVQGVAWHQPTPSVPAVPAFHAGNLNGDSVLKQDAVGVIVFSKAIPWTRK